VPVLMSGMVGSASGWQEVDYLDSSIPVQQLPPIWPRCRTRHGQGAATSSRLCYRSGAAADVMRGEETQLLGAVALGHRDGWLVLPGTHSNGCCCAMA
jgi:2-dehydro-3-deoxygalactonokinase